MTNDEFLSMLNSEFENLEKEYQSAKQKAEGTSRFNPEYEEYQYQFMIVEEKFNALKKLASLPAYARIQAMSDIEIEEYKKDKVEELDSIIKENQQKIAEADNWKLVSELKEINKKLEEKQKQIKAMTSEETKKVASYEIKDNYNLAQEIEKFKKPIDKFTEFKASMTHDNIDRATRNNIEKLWWEYKTECELQRYHNDDCRIYIEDKYDLPRELREKVGVTYQKKDLDNLMKFVQEVEDGPFKQRKEFIESQCTEKKLFYLIRNFKNIDIFEPETEGNLDFWQQHTDKLKDGELSRLQSLVEEKTRLSKKIFKTPNTNARIKSLNAKIFNEEDRLRSKIANWYQNERLLSTIDFIELGELASSLKCYRESFVKSEQAITELKKTIQETKAFHEKISQGYEIKKAEIAQQIRTLAGKAVDEKYNEIDIHFEPDPSNKSYSAVYSLYDFAEAQGKIYEKEIIDKVQREAKKQADIRENELKGISKKVNPLQAKQVDKQIDEMLDELNIETLDAEVSHDMKK